MSQDFDELLSATSRDANLDKGWTEIKTASGSKADMEAIFKALSEIYWGGVVRDVAGAIVALADFDDHQPEALPVETTNTEDLLSSNLPGLLDLWNPFDAGQWQSTVSSPKPTTDSIRIEVEDTVTRLFEETPFRRRRAQSLLQALGLMDIDFVREHRQPTFRSWGQRPQVDDYHSPPLLMARQCSECRHSIRSFHFYECAHGCLDCEHHRNMAKMTQVQTGPGGDLNLSIPMHGISLNNLMHGKPPYRLCPACLMTSSHPREHLRAVRGFSKAGDKDTMEFARQLDIWEDHLDGKSLLSFGTIVLDRIAMGGGSAFHRTSSRHFFPAGNAHCAVMFGPLLIENGVTRKPGGALISHRNMPNFTASSSKDFMEFFTDSTQWKLHDEEEVVHNKLFSVSSDRRLYSAEKPVKERRFMSSRKQVSGGLFTGFCDRFSLDEEEIVTGLLGGAQLWSILKARDLKQGAHRQNLTELARSVTEMIKAVFEFEINKFLLSFAGRLHKQAKLQYSRMSNNCQDFCNAMILNDDKWDQLFTFTYPPVPTNRDHEEDNVQLRYMMSFAGRMKHPMDEIPFVNPLVCSGQLYESFGQNDADLIDHVTSIRLREDPNAFGLSLFPNSHDEFLMKDSEFTCPKIPDGDGWKPQKPCTIADHLLDGPHDNLSVLTFHTHRLSSLYTIQSPDTSSPYHDPFLSTFGPGAWLSNRLEILHRLLLLNTYLSSIAQRFQHRTRFLPTKELQKVWAPPNTVLARAWCTNKRAKNGGMEKPSWAQELQSGEYMRGMTAIAMIHTHPFMQAPEVWNSRFGAIKKRLFDEEKDKSGIFSAPWNNCTCESCGEVFARMNCVKATSYARSLEGKGQGRQYLRSHPDYVSFEQLGASLKVLGEGDEVVVELLAQLDRTPEYLEAL